ncbi:hypothetical protein PTI98_011083 [Pleurotus ostreatus]|nr:hypothetical protein PTI98_011083 [Pleurotus ostreatus]
MDAEEGDGNPQHFSTFEKHDELLKLQEEFLSWDLHVDPANSTEDSIEWNHLTKMQNILLGYQEQSYLLDPYLERFVLPVIEAVKAHAHATVMQEGIKYSKARMNRLCRHLYGYIRFRGYKNIVKFFPHEIADLGIARDYMLHENGFFHVPSEWELRYIVFLWLSLVCMIPFDLSQFDEVAQRGRTAQIIEEQARGQLHKTGLERDGAALLLSRLYVRGDTRERLHDFLRWSLASAQTAQDPVLCIGILQVLCEVAKSASAEEVRTFTSDIFRLGKIIDDDAALSTNTLTRKFRTKAESRIALRLLPGKPSRQKGRILGQMEDEVQDEDTSDDFEVPEEVETVLEHLFESLKDKNTVVRWTAAKGVARISERLPTDFKDQVLETVMSHFAIHSIAAASLYDLPAVAESTWHGACLACAEMARRSLVSDQHLPTLIEWTTKALYFDIRKGAHSIGSNVRDGAAYVLWALARSQDSQFLKPHAEHLAQRLVIVAVFDREIHIRRAASAAFQEHVGRTGFIPHGIDVLRETDFYAVSTRRTAFLTAAPAVALFEVYRESLFNHLIDVTIRHWDPAMRQIGAQSLQLICLIDIKEYGPRAEAKICRLLESVDDSDLHGSLLALSELALAYRMSYQGDDLEIKMRSIFQYLVHIPKTTVMGPRHELVTLAACSLISNTITLSEIELDTKSSVPHWRGIELAIGSPIALKMSRDKLLPTSGCEEDAHVKHLDTLIRELKSATPFVQQSLGLCLGAIGYDKFPNALPKALKAILECVDQASSPMKNNVEGRRNCYNAISQIISTIISNITTYISSQDFQQLYGVLLEGMKDYTSDERGDVGSWIRLSCVRGLAEISEMLFQSFTQESQLEAYLPPSKYHAAIAGILKQGVERLDNVRQESGEHFIRLLYMPLSPVAKTQWRLEGEDLFKSLFPADLNPSWGDGSWLYPKAVRFLDVGKYRSQVLIGLLLSLGSKTDSTHRPVSSSLITYCSDLPLASSPATYGLIGLVQDILAYAKSRAALNSVVMPALQAIHVLLEGDSLNRLNEHQRGIEALKELHSFCCRSIGAIKSTQRIHESMYIIVHLLRFKEIYMDVTTSLGLFLTHRFPSVRADTAEYLYNFLQGAALELGTDAVEEILLETEWSVEDEATIQGASRTWIEAMKEAALS